MRKILFILLAWSLATVSVFAQSSFKFNLNNDNPESSDRFYDHRNNESGRIFAKIIDEPDDEGNTPVQIKLENCSYEYKFLLFGQTQSKKDLRKKHIVIEYGNEISSSTIVQGITLLNNNPMDVIEFNESYSFPDIIVKEGETYECQIPIHLALPMSNLFCKKKMKGVEIIYRTVQISVENKDKAYDKLVNERDSLLNAFNEAIKTYEFCTHPDHNPSWGEQTAEYTQDIDNLKTKIETILEYNNWSKESKKYKRYEALKDSLNLDKDRIDNVLENYKSKEYVCDKHKKTQPEPKKCNYCDLTLEEIYKKLNNHYTKLRLGEVQKSAIWNEVKGLYNCCISHPSSKHAQAWKNRDQYREGIEEFYKYIKEYR